jgi:hypothetical protein
MIVNKRFLICVSKVIMSPLTAELKCPHGTGEDTYGAEAVTEVASDEEGEGRLSHPSDLCVQSEMQTPRDMVAGAQVLEDIIYETYCAVNPPSTTMTTPVM